MKHASAWLSARRILAVRPDNLGDVMMTTPALRALRESAPGRQITLLASPSGAAAVPFVPEIDAVLTAAVPWMPGAAATPEGNAQLIDKLRQGAFDAAVIFTVYSQSPLPAAQLCWQAGIPLRLAHCRENPYHLLTDWVPDPEPHEMLRHEVRRQLDLVASVGCRAEDEHLSFRVRPQDTLQAVRKLRSAGIDLARPWIVIHPGASAPARRYPQENFAVVAEILAGAGDIQMVLTGDENEVELVEAIARQMLQPAVSLAGMLSLGELAAVIAPAALMIANNTGPLHIAAALGTPVVDLYALTNPQHGPWKVPHRLLYHDVPCRFCYRSVCPQGHHACLRLLDPQRVAQAARELLDEGADCSRPPLPGPHPAVPAAED
ncbi:MAG: lipopolysaccharide heptosyltransferase II [Zoogloea sp.]|nr:lipopolysaccharide heptosyltransferase II [Zoogloea sp.]